MSDMLQTGNLQRLNMQLQDFKGKTNGIGRPANLSFCFEDEFYVIFTTFKIFGVQL